MSEQTTMWSVMEASTKGRVIAVEGRTSGRYFIARHGYGSLHIGKDVFATEEEALTAAKAKVAKRIASLEKTLAKMRKNPFAGEIA